MAEDPPRPSQALCSLRIDGPVATLALNRPEQRNAISIDMLRDLHAAVDSLASRMRSPGVPPDEVVRVVVVEGRGKSFCAGMDLRQVMGDADAPLTLLSSLGEFALKLRALPGVVVAKVRGAAIGGGCGLTCVCDLSVTHDDCKLGFPEVDLGVCPAVVAPWLVRKIGAGRARAVLLQGGLMSGGRARELGIADVSVEREGQLDDAVASLVERLVTGGADAIGATKALLNELDDSMDRDIASRAAQLSAKVLATPDAQQRLAARFAQRG